MSYIQRLQVEVMSLIESVPKDLEGGGVLVQGGVAGRQLSPPEGDVTEPLLQPTLRLPPLIGRQPPRLLTQTSVQTVRDNGHGVPYHKSLYCRIKGIEYDFLSIF